MQLVRPLVLILLHNNIHLKSKHIPGIENNLCDAISRSQVTPSLLRQYGANSQPTHLPHHLMPDNFSINKYDQLHKTMTASIQPTTANTYQHHYHAFLEFVTHNLNLTPQIPAQPNHICLFIVHLANLGLSTSTIRTYLSAVSFVHKIQNLMDPTAAFVISKTLQGINNLQGSTSSPRLPITKPILHNLLQTLAYAVPTNQEHIIWHALFSFTYHACLRAGEVTLSRNPHNVIKYHQLSLYHTHFTIQFHNYKHSQGNTPLLTIQSQDPGTPCPVTALRHYINLRGTQPGQLFINIDKTPLTIDNFSSVLRNAVAIASLPAGYTTHSFRVGKATQMASEGQPDHLIRRAGRWKSSAYHKYLRPDNITLPR